MELDGELVFNRAIAALSSWFHTVSSALEKSLYTEEVVGSVIVSFLFMRQGL